MTRNEKGHLAFAPAGYGSRTTRLAVLACVALFIGAAVLGADKTPPLIGNSEQSEGSHRATVADVDIPLQLDEPRTIKQPVEHRISVLNDGIAHLHLRPSLNGDPTQIVDLSLSAFKAEDQPAGLSSLYFAKPTFGSFADYVAILAWAVGIDQGKNLIQLLKTYPADGVAGIELDPLFETTG